MKKRLRNILTSKTSKRIVSGLTAFSLLIGVLPLNLIYEDLMKIDFSSVPAEAEEEFSTAADTKFKHAEDLPGGTPGDKTVTIYPSQLVEYSERCNYYRVYHQYDQLVITSGSGSTSSSNFDTGFMGLGTWNYPFGGSVSIDANNSIVLNIDAPLFNYVYDDVTLNNNGNAFEISREYDQYEKENFSESHMNALPFLASNVVHNENDDPSATWSVKVVTPTAGDAPFLGDFGGLIGKMTNTDTGAASLTLDVTMDTSAEDGAPRNMIGYNTDLGFVCGTMESDTSLDVTVSATRKIVSLVSETAAPAGDSNYGHVGGLVGQMYPGSYFEYSGTNIQLDQSYTDPSTGKSTDPMIKATASDKYAGGIVGYNNGGTVKINTDNGDTYPVEQYIEGTAGAGGVFGYYYPAGDQTGDSDFDALNNTFDTSLYSISCQVNGTGYTGGVFGVLETDHNYSFSGTDTITSVHYSGSADGYGGLIGRYNNTSLANKLDIGGLTAASTRTGTAPLYGGAIAFIGQSLDASGTAEGGNVYVMLNGFTASAASANEMTFGGTAAKADRAFIDANNITVAVAGGHKFKGGAVVGSLESGILRMTGYTDLTNAVADGGSYRGGQIVGYRNNALIFAQDVSSWTLRRPTVNVEVDDIGSWGEVIRFNKAVQTTDSETGALLSTAYGFDDNKQNTNDTVITVNETAHTVTVSQPEYDEDDSSLVVVGSPAAFAKAALGMQLSSSSSVLLFENWSDLSSSPIRLDYDLDMTGLGINGFTRDNAETDSTSAAKCVYSGVFDGNGHTVTLAIGEPYGYHGNTAITDHSVEGSGKIYAHRYNALFGIISSSGDRNASDVTFKGSIRVKAKTTMYVGALGGQATGDFIVNNVDLADEVTTGSNNEEIHETAFVIEGASGNPVYAGGLLGKASNTIGNIEITDCSLKCNIRSSNSDNSSCIGGAIGWINYTSRYADWTFRNITVSGTLKRTGAYEVNKLGGLIAVISEYDGSNERSITLENIYLNGLAVSAVGHSSKDSSLGGLLGYSWLNVNPTFHNVQVENSSVALTGTASGKGDLAGLVYQGTGHWTVETFYEDVEVPIIDPETNEPETDPDTGEYYYDYETVYSSGISIKSITVNTTDSTNANSFGMIVNRGVVSKAAIFLEVLEDDTGNDVKCYEISSAALNLQSGCIFDELVACSSAYDASASKVLNNGQGIVSIHTDFTTDGSSSSNTYQPQTSRGAAPNDRTRYYYNLDDILNSNSEPGEMLMIWALNIYAHKSLRSYFSDLGSGFSITRDSETDEVTATTVPYDEYNMENYSWYPVNMTGAATINGYFTFYNGDFEESERIMSEDTNVNSSLRYKRTSLYDLTNNKMTQHHLMHCGLFRNVTGGITIGASGVYLDGDVGLVQIQKTGSNNSTYIERSSGALVCGTISGSSAAAIASFDSANNKNAKIVLSGISVNGRSSASSTEYAPLLINKIGAFTNINVKNVSNDNSSYDTDQKIASSLIGDAGSADATNINISFSNIKLDGRKTTSSGYYSLDGVYHTTSSLFTRSTLLNSFKYFSGSGVYDYTMSEDWTRSGSEGSYTYSRTSSQGVTYGSEISDPTNRNQHYGKEFCYKKVNDSDAAVYTNYSPPTGTSVTDFSGFLPYVYDVSTADDVDSERKYQLKVNWTKLTMSGCGTYNDPYILTSADDFKTIAEIMTGTVSGKTVVLPKLNAAGTDTDTTPAKLKQKKWNDYGTMEFTSTGGDFTNGSDSFSKETVMNYIAGAYYKIASGQNITLNSGFTGFGYTSTEQAVFRGVIVGDNNNITLTGDYPLIYQSNGCVVKNINVIVNKSQIILRANSTSTFSYATQAHTDSNKNGNKAYGAVIGKIMGGDNIIDGVSVSFGSSKILMKDTAAQSIPVGGYVGVVVKGTLVFRGMESYRASEQLWSSISGLGAATVKDDNGNSNLLYTDPANKTPNMKWLYVNPIVGRVINAAVFTEGSAYRPFENGTREGVYIKKSSSEPDPENIADYRSVAVDTTYEKFSQPVTMRNGTKNYSIADITDNLDMFVLNDIPERTSGFLGNEDFRRYLKIDLSMPNAQSLYVMSLVTQAGLGGSNYLERSGRGRDHNDSNYYPYNYNKPIGGFANTGDYGIAPYYSYRSTHVGQYTYVGNCGGSSVPEPTGSEAWYSDYSSAKTDNAQFNRSGGTSKHSWQHGLETIPYLIGKYTPKINSNTTGHAANAYDSNYFNNINGKELGYIAFCLTQQYSYLNLTFSASNSVYYMPDGFRGLGCLGYKSFLDKNDDGTKTEWTERYQDMIVHIFGINGNGNTVDLNMSLYNYYQINGKNDAYAVNNVCPGFGFIDAMMQNKTCAVGTAVNGRYDNIDVTDNDYQIRDFTLTGSVKSVVIDASSGNNYPMNNNINSNYFVAVGGLVGNVVYYRADGNQQSGGDIFKTAISDINLSNLKVNGVRNTGGLMGYNQSENHADSKTTITNITTSDLEVSSGIYTGGLIGYTTQTAVEISDVTIAEPNIKSKLNFSGGTYTANATGGIIGYADTGSATGPVYLHEITIGTKSPGDEYSAYIGYTAPDVYPSAAGNETVRVGGLIGQIATNSSTMIASAGSDHIDYNTLIEKCNVYNVDMKGHKLGGMIGASENANCYIGVVDSIVKSNPSDPKTLYGAHFEAGATGGIIGYTENLNNKATVQNCSVEGYKLESNRYTGGIFGNFAGSNTTYQAKICDVSVKDIMISSNNNAGALVGYVNKSLNGYNIRTDNIQFKSFLNGSQTYIGHIVGSIASGKALKIAGFSRQNMAKTVSNYSQKEYMVGGNSSGNGSYNYGSGGYVIFADYQGKSKAADKNLTASTVNDTNNVALNTYSIETETDNTVNNYPYVTTNPKRNIDSTQFLTGDAISAMTYNASVFAQILSNTNGAGAYKSYGTVTSAQAKVIENKLQASYDEFPSGLSGISSFPLLVVDDNDYKAVTNMINSYIRVLTNTGESENYALDNSIHKVSLFKCVLTDGAFEVDTSANNTACLKRFDANGMYFKMNPSDVDNANSATAQFSLIDVQFFDPSTVESDGTTTDAKVAYHLYVPVYVKKLLEFSFSASLLSNTEYYSDAYSSVVNGNTVFDNLGNPVTLKIEYAYERTAEEWKKAINAGEDVLHNINKTLHVTKHHTENDYWPSGTRMVLVDANNMDKHYYLDDPPSNGTIDLHAFSNNGEYFEAAPFQNLMTVTISQPTAVSERTLVETDEDDPDAIVRYKDESEENAEYVYYRLIKESETDSESEDYIPPEERYAVTSVSSDISSEKYYITIFTPKNTLDDIIYHYEIESDTKLSQIVDEDDENYVDVGWRPNQVKRGNNTIVGLYTGNLYDTTITMDVNSKTNVLEMTSNNNYLDVEMVSTIKLNGKSDKINEGVAGNMLRNQSTSSIYQTFLATYDMKSTYDGSSVIGVQMSAKPAVSVYEYKLFPGDEVVEPDPDDPDSDISKNVGYSKHISENYIELRTDEDIIDDICKAANDYAVTFRVKCRFTYVDPLDLPIQFPINAPVNGSTDSRVGTRVIGYSNISSSAESAAYSATSKKCDTETNRYYVTSQKKAELDYHAVKTSGQLAGPYSELGINAAEPDVDEQGNETYKTSVKIHTQAKYDTSMLKDAGDFVEFTLKLSEKTDYDSYLKISDYINNILVTGRTNSVLFKQGTDNNGTEKTNYEGDVVVKISLEDNAYKIRVRKDQLQTIGNASDGVFLIPIEFEAYTGDAKFNEKSGGLKYSNYRFTLEVKMYSAVDTPDANFSTPSKIDDYIIYSNAKVLYDVID